MSQIETINPYNDNNKTPQELDGPWEKERITLNSFVQLASLDSVEWISWRNKILRVNKCC